MTAKILDGKTLSTTIKNDIRQRVQQRLAAKQIPPGLDVILVGNDPASEIYVQHKQAACQYTGIRSQLHQLPHDITQRALIQLIDDLNQAPDVHGILLQVPLPNHLDTTSLLERIAPHKDVDGFHPYNIGRLLQRKPLLRPCTPYGIIQLLNHYNIHCIGKHAVIVGASNIVGRPMALELLLKKATVTICHRFTTELERHVRQADILISAIGKPNIIQLPWITAGTVVVDAGITRLPNHSIVGDIHFESAKEKASWITPVPGGVGPMTVATLLQNTLHACEQAFHS